MTPSDLIGRCRTALLVAVLLGPIACASDGPTESVGGDDEALLTDAEPHVAKTLRVLQFETPDKSGQTVHPDFAQMPSWPSPFLLVLTPYPYGSSTEEKPSLYARTPGFDWVAPAGLTNPIARPSSGYLSDPDIVAIPDAGEVWVYYREVKTDNRILLIRTKDGVHFDTPVEVVNGTRQTVVSPAIVRRDSTRWRMWSVNAGDDGCRAKSTTVEIRRSADGQHWAKPVAVSLTQPGLFVWHIDVQWIPSRHEYWALYNAKKPGTCTTTDLYLATSTDGMQWTTFPSPVLSAGVIPEFADIVYRSTFAYDAKADAIRLWYSGARYFGGAFIWSTAFDRRDRAELFEAIQQPATSAARRELLPWQAVYFNPP
jgi:hypothetical protein